MITDVSVAEGLHSACPECTRCFSDPHDACPECGRERPTDGWPAPDALSLAYLGSVLGERYRLEQCLGGGSAGTVYLARDLRLRRPFAVKILDAPAGSEPGDVDKLRRQFEDEVEALSRIRNPHVVNIHEALELEGGTPAVLTEYVQGATLAELLDDQGAIGLDAALLSVEQVANGLHEAHCRGVVHRDVKPSNVIVERLPAAGLFARILDFGLVHLVEAEQEGGGFRGTPLYASPEQCHGNREITRQTDIYALGCVLYHLVAGRPPFDLDDARSIIFAHVDSQPEPLSEVARVEVPDPLDRLVDRMLEKDPGDRPEDLSDVVETIKRVDRPTAPDDSFDAFESETLLAPTTSQHTVQRRESAGANIFQEHEEDTEQIEQLVQFVDLKQTFPDFDGSVVVCAVSATGDCAALVDSSGRVHMLSIPAKGYAESYRSAGDRMIEIAARSKSGSLLGVDPQGNVYEWSFSEPSSEPVAVCSLEASVRAIDASPRSRRLYFSTASGEIRMYDRRTSQTGRLCAFDQPVSMLRVVEGGERAVGISERGQLVIVDELSGAAEPRIEAELDRAPTAFAYSGAARALLVSDGNGDLVGVRIGAVQGPEVVETSIEHLQGLAVTRERTLLGFGLRDGVAHTWRIRHEWLDDVLEWLGTAETGVERGRKERAGERKSDRNGGS